MKKYMIVGLVPILLQSAMLQASEAEFYQAIEPSLQSARGLLTNSTIAVQLEPVLNELITYVQNGIIAKNVAVNKIHDIKMAVLLYKNRQYPNYFLSWFVATPQIVKDVIDPALSKIDKALSILNGSMMQAYILRGLAITGTLVTVSAGAYGLHIWRKKAQQKKISSSSKRLIDEEFGVLSGDESVNKPYTVVQ